MPKLLKLLIQLSLFCGIWLSVLTSPGVGSVSARSGFSVWQNLSSGPLSLELWESVKGEFSAWQVEEGRLLARLQPPPIHLGQISAVAPLQKLWPVKDNYIFTFDYTPFDSADKNIAILFKNVIGSDGKVKLDFLSFHFIYGILHIENFVGNYSSHRAGVPFNLEPGQTYQVKIIYQRPDFIFYVNDELLFSSLTDHGFWPDFPEPGRPLFYISRGIHPTSAAEFSNFALDYLAQLSVPYFSQLDWRWQSQPYDDVLRFGLNKSIADWGCALSSAAMLLQYYGYSEINGQELTPASLNDWLSSQGDGYLGQGLVNWLAISRLSRDLSQLEPELERPILEFSWSLPDKDVIIQQLQQAQPVIADLGEHFVVITGENGEVDETGEPSSHPYLINDPLFGAINFADQYSQIESLRLFQPSQTDLSYWLLFSQSALEPIVKNVAQEILWPQTVTEHLPGGQNLNLFYWSKPSEPISSWCIKNLESGESPAKLLLYDQLGQVNIFELSLLANQEQCWQLTLNDNAPSDWQALLVTPTLTLTPTPTLTSTVNPTLTPANYLIYQLKFWQYLQDLQNQQANLGRLDNVARYQTLIERFLSF